MAGRTKKLIITIDGPSGTGKSTAARLLARRLGYLYLDTGAMYRAVALKALRKEVNLTDSKTLAKLAERCRVTFRKSPSGRMRVFLDGKDVTVAIRKPKVSEAASRAALVPGVRRALVRQQRALGRRGGIVAEGRDTGTVVFPRAGLKFYLTAALTERAKRRHRELCRAGISVRFPEVLRQVRKRDRRDRSRSASPLKPARGAVRVDNTSLKSGKTFAILVDYARRAQAGGSVRH